MRRFEYLEPGSLEEAVSLMRPYNGEASILAGGTDLLVEIREHKRWPKYVVNIKGVPDLDHLIYDEEKGLKIGSLVTTRSLELLPIVIEKYAGLYQAVRELGSIQVRNRATLAGNICRASPSDDTIPPLIARAAGAASAEEFNDTWIRAEANPIPPRIVDTGPIHELVMVGSEVDVQTLPISRHFKQDAGRYIGSGILVCKDPDTGVRNLSYQRLLIKGRLDTLLCSSLVWIPTLSWQ